MELHSSPRFTLEFLPQNILARPTVDIDHAVGVTDVTLPIV